MANKTGRRYFDPCQEVRCWLDSEPGPSAGCSAVPGAGWTRKRVEAVAREYAKRMRERAELVERWLFVMRHGSAPEGKSE